MTEGCKSCAAGGGYSKACRWKKHRVMRPEGSSTTMFLTGPSYRLVFGSLGTAQFFPVAAWRPGSSLRLQRRYYMAISNRNLPCAACQPALAGSGNPLIGFPTDETLHRSLSSPLLIFSQDRYFALCGGREGALPLSSPQPFEKAGENFYSPTQGTP